MTRHDRAAIVLYLCVAVSLAFLDHRVRRERFQHHPVTEYIPSVLAGTSGAPAKYRVLMPYGLNAVTTRTGADAYSVFLIAELVFIAAALMMTHLYLRRWYSGPASLAGTLALAAFLPLTFTNTWAHPDTFPELLFFAAGSLAIASRRDLLFAVILLVGSFNRETIGFLAALWAIERLSRDRSAVTVFKAAAYFGICAAVYFGLRWARGFEHYRMFMLGENIQMLKLLPPGFDPYTRVAGYFWLLLVGAPASLAILGARRPGSPPFFRHAIVVALLYIAVVWLFAAIIESRVLVPTLALLLPPALHYFVDVRSDGGR